VGWLPRISGKKSLTVALMALVVRLRSMSKCRKDTLSMVEQVVSKFGRLDTAYNNARIHVPRL
jgi:hypothetical protein